MFNIGDRIAHPLHGAGVIENIEEKRINGVSREYYILKLPVGGMTVMIPVDGCDNIGVRPIISPERADEIISAINDIDAEMTSNWNKRYRENMERIKSGNLIEVARVIKGLMERDSAKGLSTGERKMLHSAKQILISEIVLSQDTTYESVERRINAAII